MEQKTFISSSMVNINGKENFKQTAIKVKNGKKKGVENKNGIVRTIPKRELNNILNNMDNTRSKSFHSPFETLPFMNRVNLIVNELNDSMIPKIPSSKILDRVPTPHPRKRKTRRDERKKQKQTKKKTQVKKASRKTITEKKKNTRNIKKTKKNRNNNYNANNNTN